MLETKTSFEMETLPAGVVISAGEENSVFAKLSASLAEIRKLKGVLGYILRSNTSAIVDLNESDKIIDYAVLSSEMNESCFEMTKQFNLGESEFMIIEGENVKVLCMNIGENKVSVFLEKSASPDWIINRIQL
jgi:predicted regulator of Ras-like GTPase activity (Roadblock/LC7/MglB family)